MYKELALYDKSYDENDVRQGLFLAIKHGFGGVSMPTVYLPAMKDFLQEGMVISTPIDFPYGFLDTSLREYSIISAHKRGATAIDLVASAYYLNNRKLEKFYEDVLHQRQICKAYDLEMRLICDYKGLPTLLYNKLCKELGELGVEYIVPTVDLVDYFEDNLLACIDISNKTKVNAICNGSIWKKSQYDTIENSGIFGVRFNNIRSVEQIFGV